MTPFVTLDYLECFCSDTAHSHSGFIKYAICGLFCDASAGDRGVIHIYIYTFGLRLHACAHA